MCPRSSFGDTPQARAFDTGKSAILGLPCGRESSREQSTNQVTDRYGDHDPSKGDRGETAPRLAP